MNKMFPFLLGKYHEKQVKKNRDYLCIRHGK